MAGVARIMRGGGGRNPWSCAPPACSRRLHGGPTVAPICLHSAPGQLRGPWRPRGHRPPWWGCLAARPPMRPRWPLAGKTLLDGQAECPPWPRARRCVRVQTGGVAML
eukprot:4914267-Alexandrium_andersonii.AAC.1